MKKVNDNNKLAIQMLIAMVSGIVVGLLFMAIRESVGADSKLWITINSVLFQNISAAGTTGSNPLLVYLFIGYPVHFALVTKKNPLLFIKKIFKVIVFGFSTSSSAATLPLNQDTTTKELGVDSQIASFVLPLGMTINMDGTAIMQVVATLLIAGCGDYDVTVFQLVIIMVLALIAYSLILAINRPIEMLATSLNVTGDALTSIAVAKSEGKLNLDAFNKK